MVVVVVEAELSGVRVGVVVIELGGDSGGVVELASGSNLTTGVATGIEPFEDCEHAETSHITVVMTINPHATTRFLHFIISLTPVWILYPAHK